MDCFISLKYFFLLFSDPETFSLDEYVFNVASHPFKIPGTKNSQVNNWKDPQDDQVSYLNPPAANTLGVKNQGQQKIFDVNPRGSSGTYLQQWSRTNYDAKTPVSESVTRSGR
jgi:mannosyl-oligosaccharide alpha-1,2-mannosidase